MVNNKEERMKKIKQFMQEKNLDSFLVSKQENQGYLTGFPSPDIFVLLTKEENFILTDFRYIEVVKDQCGDFFQILLLDQGKTVYDFLKKRNCDSLGIEEETLTVAQFKKIEEVLPKARIVYASGAIEKIREIKEASELESIKQAVQLTDLCFSHMLGFLRAGLTEKECALEIEMFLKKNGAERLSFDTICVSGVRTSLPHGVPSNKKIEIGDFVTMDFGCMINGYCSDMTRTVAIGQVSEEQKEVYEIVLEAQKHALDHLKAGLTYAEGDRLSRDVIEAAGYGEFFGRGLGHGVGLEIHEAPTMSPKGNGIFKPNMTVTVEPGIYLPKKFGIRIEDLAIVTSFGIINDVKSKKELIII